jgi:hypothetical protein
VTAYTLNLRAGNSSSNASGIRLGHIDQRRAGGAASGLRGHQAADDAVDALTELTARSTVTGALAAFAAADLAAPQHDLRAELAAVRSSELLLRAAERAAFGVPALLPDAAAAAGAVSENHAVQVEIAATVPELSGGGVLPVAADDLVPFGQEIGESGAGQERFSSRRPPSPMPATSRSARCQRRGSRART